MSANSVSSPFPIFSDVDGQPLDDGYIYVGDAGADPESYPKTLYWDPGLTLVAAQPVRTIGGYPSRYGTPARVYADADDYSIVVRNKTATTVYTALNSTTLTPVSTLTGQLAASRVDYTPGYTGGAPTTVDLALDEFKSVKSYGAVGDGVTDDTAAVQACIDDSAFVYFPEGTYLCGTLTVLTHHVISGVGMSSVIKSNSAGAALVISLVAGALFMRVRDIKIEPTVVGGGTYGIDFILAGAGGYMSNWEVSGVFVGDFGSYGVHFNNDIGNVNGFFTGTLRRSWVTNGINGSNMGDSITIAENTITGRNTGILCTHLPGARQIVYRDNNITTTGGAIACINGEQVQMYNNQIEHPAYLGNYDGAYASMVFLLNCSGCSIRDNTITPAHTASVASDYCVLLDGTTNNTSISGNVISRGEVYHVGTGTDATYNKLHGDNFYDEPPINLLQATIGLGFDINLTPLNSWVAYAGDTNIQFHKDTANNVTVRGAVANGTVTPGAIIATLPVGARPLSQKRFQVTNYDGATFSSATLLVNTSGDIIILSAGVSNVLLHLDGIQFNEYIQ